VSVHEVEVTEARGVVSPDLAQLRADRDRFVARGMYSSSTTFAVRGEGTRIIDIDGREFIDFATGISVMNLGHRHPQVQAAILEQAGSLVHSGAPVMMPVPYVRLAERLCRITPGDFAKKALLINSGAEAVENAAKILRQATGRPVIFSFDGSFHGRTLLTMTMSGKMLPYRQNFGPYPGSVHRLPFPNPYHRPAGLSEAQWTDFCLESFQNALATLAPPDQVAGVFVEPVQGEGGFVVPPADFLPRLAQLCRDHAIPLVADEIQTGFGRTGKMFAVEHYGVEPDLILVAKSLGGGFPLSGVVGRAELMDATAPGGIGGTFGGNPVACAAALAVIDVIETDHLVDRAARLGEAIRVRLRGWQERYPAIGDVRGLGAMNAFELVSDPGRKTPTPQAASAVVHACHERGLLVLKAGLHDNVVRLLPPLTVSDADLAEGLGVLGDALAEVFGGSGRAGTEA
jgi:4-aminobutyrate aminotransferase / (S)-3-amino-2-methylpropionate transaminase / 5-aminovalerate transaminase